MPVDDAWTAFNDLELIAPCFPGAVDHLRGRGRLHRHGQDQARPDRPDVRREGHLARAGRGGPTRSSSRPTARTSGATAPPAPPSPRTCGRTAPGTRVVVHTDLKITGRPAQFGRGVIQDVGSKILDQFADCLSTRLGGEAVGAPARSAGAGRRAGSTAAAAAPRRRPRCPGRARRPGRPRWRAWRRADGGRRRRARRPAAVGRARGGGAADGLPGPPRRRRGRPAHSPPCRCPRPRRPAGRRPSRPPPSWTWATSWARCCCAGSARSSPRARSPRWSPG